MLKQIEQLPKLQQKKLMLLREFLKKFENVCVAYSGGVDSTLVATIAQEQLNSKAIAITGVSPSLSPQLLKEARAQANWIGIKHAEIETNELKDNSYTTNPNNRCFACKKELHSQLKQIAISAGKETKVVDGVNHDDLSDYRPGIDAALKAGVISPLAEIKIGKQEIRQISKALGLPWWNKPAQPCLASRVPYGETITAQKLIQIGTAEEWLRNRGFQQVRVRSQGLNAKIEVPENNILELINHINRKELVRYFLSLGFSSVSLDLEGLVNGKLNRDL